MNLIDLGFDEWFEQQAAEVLGPGQSVARVTTVDRGAFLIRDHTGEAPAELAGKLRYSAQSSSDLPSVGDWVCAQYHASAGPALVHAVLPRKSFLRRKCPGKTVDFQMIAANIDVVFIVQSCHFDFNIRRLDRYLVMANEGQIKPFIILSKTDLITPGELETRIAEIRHAGISTEILALSNPMGLGIEEFRRLLIPGKTFCLIGSSGVGKTTLINRIIGRDAFDTQPVSATGEGTHTTARRQLIVLDQGAMLMDTPGMRELGILAADEGVTESFSDIHELAQGCRFSNCTHTREPGCAVLSAVDEDAVSGKRLQSFLKLKKESDFNAMSYLDKRKKDRNFGKFIKSVKKQKKKKS